MAKPLIRTEVIQRSHTIIRPFLRDARTLDQFYKEAVDNELSPKQRTAIVEQAILLLEDFYVHLPLKCAMYAIDPLRRLRLLQQQLQQPRSLVVKSDQHFHREMTQIFTSLCDQHTVYTLPTFYADRYAWLPFKVEACYVRRRRKYLVTRVLDGFRTGGLREGVEVLSWNGIPIARAVELAEAQSGGGNPAARHALALLNLTQRPLKCVPPPDEEWVAVGYRNRKGKTGLAWMQWVISRLPTHFEEEEPQGLNVPARRVQQIRKFLFAPDVIRRRRKLSAASDPLSIVKEAESIMPDVFRAALVPEHPGIGYIRIFTFDVENPDKFVKEFIRLIKRLPGAGLIIDVRDNGGGRTAAAERLLQLIAPTLPIQPQLLYFINTPLTLKLCKLNKSARTPGRSVRSLGPFGLKPWIDSIERAMETGATYSATHPITDPKLCNNIGRQYHGPVVVVTDALSYSATEFFAAGFQDHGGKVLGIDQTTGGGGANVRSHAEMRRYFENAADSPFTRLAPGTDISIALRRSQRVGTESGSEIEDYGVTPDHVYLMTPRDVLKKNKDLIEYAAKLLETNFARLKSKSASNRRGRASENARGLSK
jgi:C-terminal processing protease CtpA/Prc